METTKVIEILKNDFQAHKKTNIESIVKSDKDLDAKTSALREIRRNYIQFQLNFASPAQLKQWAAAFLETTTPFINNRDYYAVKKSTEK